jgi:hypothetical protein
MKLNELRKVIREEVRAAVKEELQEMLTEAVKIASTPAPQQMQEVPKGQPKKWSFGKNATLDEMLQQTAQEMTGEEAKNFGSGQVSKPNFATSMAGNMGLTESSGPMPGIDISKLDFVGKAKSIFDASNKKDKQRGL